MIPNKLFLIIKYIRLIVKDLFQRKERLYMFSLIKALCEFLTECKPECLGKMKWLLAEERNYK